MRTLRTPLSAGTRIRVDDRDANGHYSVLLAKVIRARGRGVLAVVMDDNGAETNRRIRATRSEISVIE